MTDIPYGTFPAESLYGGAIFAAADEIERLRISEQVAHTYVRETLERLAIAAGSTLLNPEGEPLRNFELEDVVLSALACTSTPEVTP